MMKPETKRILDDYQQREKDVSRRRYRNFWIIAAVIVAVLFALRIWIVELRLGELAR